MINKRAMQLTKDLALSLSILIAVITLCVIGLIHSTPPPALPATAPASSFSSERAMNYLQFIAQQTHPLGTAEHTKVRDYLVAELKKLGLEPQIQTSLGINKQHPNKIVGVVQNVLVRIPGKAPGKALLVAAHYDSTHTGPGAADDGASVAAILETLRALKNLPPLQNDLICIFTDGEEAGLLGAEAFIAEHPWAKSIGLVLNFEYRGNRGPLLMFETSQGNSKLITGLATIPHPLGNSLMYEVYKRLPNDTDLSVFKRAGIAGMNFSAIEGHTSYHTQLDRPELLQQESLQHEGETMLSLIRYFGASDLTDLNSSDSVYFDAPALGLVNYPVSWAVPLSGTVIVLFGAVFLRGLKRGELRFARALLGALSCLLITPLLTLTCHLLWLLIKHLHPQYQLMLQGDTYNSHWYLLAFVFLVTGTCGLFQSSIKAWIRPMELTVGASMIWLTLLIVTSVALPGASFLFLWPLAPVLIANLISLSLSENDKTSVLRAIIIVFGAAPGIMMFAPFIKALFIGLTPNQMGLIMGFLALFLGLLNPLLDVLTTQLKVHWFALVAGLLFLLTASVDSGFSKDRPRPTNLFYGLDAVTKTAFWLSKDPTPDHWTQTFFTAAREKRRVEALFGQHSSIYWTNPAPLLPLPAPNITLLADSIRSGIRKITIQVRSLRHAPELQLFVEGVDVINSKVENRILSEALIPDWHLQAFAMPEKGLTLDLTVQSGHAFKIRAFDLTYSLPETNFPARPADIIPQPSGFSDTTLVANAIDLK